MTPQEQADADEVRRALRPKAYVIGVTYSGGSVGPWTTYVTYREIGGVRWEYTSTTLPGYVPFKPGDTVPLPLS